MPDTFMRIATKIRVKLHQKVIRGVSKAFPSYRFKSMRNEVCRIGTLPRHKAFDTRLLLSPIGHTTPATEGVSSDGKIIKAIDPGSYLGMYREIFEDETYRFRASSDRPYIVDCGANIGLSVIYFKSLYPAARIIAFEPDPHVFELLESNVREFGHADVTLIRKGVWNADGMLSFVADSEEGWGGHVAQESQSYKANKVSVTRLRSYLTGHVDLLKLDIEGAECEVIADCADLLANVNNVFIEFHSFVDRAQCLGRLLSVLTDAGFRIHLHSVGAHSRKPFINFASLSNGMDMQLNIFGVRKTTEGLFDSKIEPVHFLKQPVSV